MFVGDVRLGVRGVVRGVVLVVCVCVGGVVLVVCVCVCDLLIFLPPCTLPGAAGRRCGWHYSSSS